MVTSVVRNRRPQQRVCLHLEELETRALPSAAQALPVYETVNSTNWSGYAAETNLGSPASNAVTAVSGSWIVPTVTGKTNAYSSVWVGIDGYSSNSVEQLGTEQDTTKSGGTRYYAWWEMYPNPSVLISGMTISPGDSMSASVTYNAGVFTLQMTDNTTGQSFSTNQSATAQRSSAEWIVEAPSSGTVLPLANFGTAHISAAQATINGVRGAIDNASWQNTAINMVTRSGSPLDQTSGLTDTTTSPITSSFTVTFTGSGGGKGGGGHGHGPLQTLEFNVPVPFDFQAPASPKAVPNSTAPAPAAPAGSELIVVTPAADAVFAQVQEGGSTAGLKTWWGTLPSDLTNGILRSDIQGLDGLFQR
jgi:hypothetical protein